MLTLRYVVLRGQLKDKEAFVKIVKDRISTEVGEKVMTIAEMFREDGMRQGSQKTMQEVAKSMLAESIDMDLIVRVTKMSPEEILSLR